MKAMIIPALISTLFLYYCNDKKQVKEEEIYSNAFPNEAKYDSHIKKISQKHKLNWLFAKAILIKESHYKENAVSISGAVGLMQLMPRKGSFTNINYKNYMKARRQRRNSRGLRIYKGKSALEWGKLYQTDLRQLVEEYGSNPEKLYKLDKRFDPYWNIESGIKQLAKEYHFFKKRGHSDYKSKILASSAYNAGRSAVRLSKRNKRYDRIPINRQTELYIGGVVRILNALERGNGRIFKWEEWVTWI